MRISATGLFWLRLGAWARSTLGTLVRQAHLRYLQGDQAAEVEDP